MKGLGWPGVKKNEKPKGVDQSDLVKQEELDAVNWMFRKLAKHRKNVKTRKEIALTRDTCVFSHTNENSPCFPTHPCAKIKHGQRTRAIIVKCFWHIVRPYCENNHKHVGALIKYRKNGQNNDQKNDNRQSKGDDPTKLTISSIDGKRILPLPVINDVQGDDEVDRELREEEELEKKEDDEMRREEETEREDEEIIQKANDPYDAEELEEYDEACEHVLHDTFVDAITWYESKGLKPELEENEKLRKENEEKILKDDEERRKHRFMPNDDENTHLTKKEKEKQLIYQKKQDELIASLPPPDPKIHNLLKKKSSKLKVVSGLKIKIKNWYMKHGMSDKANDDVHMNELAIKYANHQDLLFTRLHVKYHQTRD